MRGGREGRARNADNYDLMVGGTGLEQTSNRKQPTAPIDTRFFRRRPNSKAHGHGARSRAGHRQLILCELEQVMEWG